MIFFARSMGLLFPGSIHKCTSRSLGCWPPLRGEESSGAITAGSGSPGLAQFLDPRLPFGLDDLRLQAASYVRPNASVFGTESCTDMGRESKIRICTGMRSWPITDRREMHLATPHAFDNGCR